MPAFMQPQLTSSQKESRWLSRKEHVTVAWIRDGFTYRIRNVSVRLSWNDSKAEYAFRILIGTVDVTCNLDIM
ncbi:hypothetical protein TNCT_35021 [Trichonephila clavata]|uniref:Uncharacterized protein n=1 Tax=Trichonephila clavata TaxID=2740835 RepID=A0A8X6H0B2_TRICU|nr:hypothetical protein TNCT_35021 [Trichonephila clavata]